MYPVGSEPMNLPSTLSSGGEELLFESKVVWVLKVESQEEPRS